MTELGTRQRLRDAMDLDPRWVHLNNAGVAPMCRPARQAITRCAELMAERGFYGVEPLIAEYERARSTFAELVGCPPQQLAMTQTCAASISLVAFGLDLRPTDEILFLDQEYPSNAYPWQAAAQRAGAGVKVIASGPDLSVDVDRLIDAISARTRVVALSWIQYQTGAQVELAPIAEACHRHGAWLVVDAIQGLGVVPFDLATSDADAVCGGCHKWLLGPLGHGFLGLAEGRAEELTPVLQGALSYGSPDDPYDLSRGLRTDARRFEPGAPPLLGATGGAAGARLLLELGVTEVNRAALEIADRVADAAEARGARVLSARGQAARSPITTFVPAAPLAEVQAALQRAGVACAARGGGIRVAPHAFNSEDDVARLVAALDEC